MTIFVMERVEMVVVQWSELTQLCSAALRATGAGRATAAVLSGAIVGAERRGKREVGVAHLFDYLAAFDANRINKQSNPTLDQPRPSILRVNGDDGTAHDAFNVAQPALVRAVRQYGVAVLSLTNCFTAGELGHFTSKLVATGCIAMAVSNSPALMSLHGSRHPIAGTNPFSFAVPTRPTPHLIDQASSVAAWVRVRDAAAARHSIPEGWALDVNGQPTTDAQAALLGPLLPFGGSKGSNLAMTIEMLAALSGASFSVDASQREASDQPPRTGLFVLALDPAVFDPDYISRVELHLERLRRDFAVGFGRRSAELVECQLDAPLYRRLQHAAHRTP